MVQSATPQGSLGLVHQPLTRQGFLGFRAMGAPLRLRVERQLGYKQAKYLMRIEVTDRLDRFGRGKGGFWEDRGYEWYAGI
jgi:DMSO/TMAO reductase YedYZ molybdopterin-dependent catalytic subunit